MPRADETPTHGRPTTTVTTHHAAAQCHHGHGSEDEDDHHYLMPPQKDNDRTGEDGGDHDPDLHPFVAHAAHRIAYALNDCKRYFDDRDGATLADARGSFQLVVSPHQYYEFAIATSEERDENPVTVQASLRHSSPNNAPRDNTTTTAASLSPSAAAKRHSQTNVHPDTPYGEDGGARKRRRVDLDDDDREVDANGDTPSADQTNDTPLPIADSELHDLVSQIRESTTAQSIAHLQSLLHRAQTTWEQQQQQQQQPHPTKPVTTTTTTTAFPTPGADDPDDAATSAAAAETALSPLTLTALDRLSHERELLSKQIQWVEECRRVAETVKDTRTENWRSTSAAFHDVQRQDRERFQNRILGETGANSAVLNQILAEVRNMGLHMQSLKWETPGSFATASTPTPVNHAPPPPPMWNPSPASASASSGVARPRFPTVHGHSTPTPQGNATPRRASSNPQREGR